MKITAVHVETLELQMEEPFVIASSALAVSPCDLGRVDEARGLLDRLEELRAVAPTETASICPDLVRGRLALVAGDLATATRHLEAAYEWGKARSFADLVYAPPVSLARAELSVSAEAGGEARWASALRRMQDVLAAAPKFGQLDRYAGEVYTQFARALWRTGQLEQAKTWADKAETWFESRPNHLRAPELHALLALLTIATGATGAKPAKGAEAVRLRALGLATRARALVRQQGESFAGAEDRAAFYRAHAANEMLAGEPMLAEASART